MKYILKTLVGSREHGLHTDTSDYDYRGVFVEPTSRVLSLSRSYQKTHWVEDRPVDKAGNKADDTAWEIGHFLELAMHCNPSILEVLNATAVESDDWGMELRSLFRYMWQPRLVTDAFIGYGHNQRKKMMEDKDKRGTKWATAYLRTLIQAERLHTHRTLITNFATHDAFQTLLMIRNGLLTMGTVLDLCMDWENRVREAEQKSNPDYDPAKIDEFYLRLRKANWE